MSRICPYCEKKLSTQQRLDYHIARYHRTPSDEYSPTKREFSAALSQWGGGKPDIFSDGASVDSSGDEADDNSSSDMVNNSSSEVDDNSSNEMDGDTDDDDDDDDDDSNWVFHFIKSLAKDQLEEKRQTEDIEYDLKAFKKQFRWAYACILIWMHALRNNDINKKVVNMARSLRNNNDHGYNESIHAAVKNRKFLLDKLVTEEDMASDSDDVPN